MKDCCVVSPTKRVACSGKLVVNSLANAIAICLGRATLRVRRFNNISATLICNTQQQFFEYYQWLPTFPATPNT